MTRIHRLPAVLILIGLTVMLMTFRIATAPGFIAMLSGAAVVVAGMGWFVLSLLRAG